MKRFLVAAMLALVPCLASAAEPLDIPGFMAIPRPVPSAQLRYGDAPAQAIDVFLPPGDGPDDGPFPVVVLIHGGCWSAKTAAREQLRHLGADLASRGIATWSIGYRRADEAGGGYPGTYRDVGAAIDRLREEAPRYRLDPARSVLVGHSAGGHLALWAASRARVPAGSAVRSARPFVPRGVVAIAGVGDLEKFAPSIDPICGPGIAGRLIDMDRPDPYADVSPAALPAPAARIVMVSGVLDKLVPPYVAHDYAQAVRGRAVVERVDIPDAGHFDLVGAGPAWRQVRRLIEQMLTR
jgi:acetyl esterase/lipase